jgi:diaminohydroxyphosphoribosylaminopyrimidine deaminase/5-amino-6-(5-phosphoribosylamino)uracil reductase
MAIRPDQANGSASAPVTGQTADEQFMDRALALAERGKGWTSPNPMVGAVIVGRDGAILGEGWHEQYGGPHAETNALADARARGNTDQLAGSTLYVNLEPCAHEGKTPPCDQQLVAARFGRVVIAQQDPHSRVAGRGITRLRAAGMEVVVGVRQAKASALNRIFLHWITRHTPYVCVKVAVSQDGKITRAAGTQTAISNQASQRFAHELRQQFDAVVVGVDTVRIDNPQLTVRYGVPKPRHPLRVILDAAAQTPLDARVLADHNCLIFVTTAADPAKVQALSRKADVEVCAVDGSQIPVARILELLADHGVSSLLVEGGQTVLTQFALSGCVQEWIMARSPKVFGRGVDFVRDPAEFAERFVLERSQDSTGDTLEFYRPRQ